MNTHNLTPDQLICLEQFKAQGVSPAHLQRIAARYERSNIAPQVIKGITEKESDSIIRGIEDSSRQ